ncbi:hypothetical protein A2153_03720 [Candidatus Gottesmanbacteria bacterium RBG_16_38_7b]|uniref:DUF2283 domain-containing protein n=2 Tax=Candidatus Gottesmaniibacteriota TaxID=1752720 RepID=A0A1F5YHJ1_9BACT|nr:MAG: hypothetical protein A2153_03720 [Candidatus Gottesmanbacteria bacterium RBG_16_38_7b]OGG31026.1 MAG: hypothetical protein A3I51_05960 [Candidatus Gottesmanbacteria bacterium RIFCSPLOWO2_02_FULL_38_8]
MNVNYDPVADAMYITFLKGKKSTKTVEVGDNILLDYNGKKLIGIEILDASEKLSTEELENITLTIPTYKGKVNPSI